MTRHQSQDHALGEISAILRDMEQSGATPRRAARRLREALDYILASEGEQPDTEVPLDIGAPPVTEEAAGFLVVHHLGLAAAYLEAAGPGIELLLTRARHAERRTLWLPAERAWLREMERAYREADQGPEEDILGEGEEYSLSAEEDEK